MISTKRAATALAAACALALMTACGGGGSSSSSSSSSSGSSSDGGSGGNVGAGSPYVLFASDFPGNIAAFRTLAPTPGTTLTGDLVLTVPSQGTALAYDAARDELYVLSALPSGTIKVSVEVFANASTMTAGQHPARTLVMSTMDDADYLTLDTVTDTLWVGGSVSNNLSTLAFHHASTLSGNVVPDQSVRTFFDRMAIDDTRDLLYAINEFGLVDVYTHPASLDGMPSADHQIGVLAFGGGLALDAARDILYLCNFDQTMRIVHGASTAGLDSPVVSLDLPAGTTASSAFVDSAHDRLYVAGGDKVFVFENASTLTASSTVPVASVEVSGDAIDSLAF